MELDEEREARRGSEGDEKSPAAPTEGGTIVNDRIEDKRRTGKDAEAKKRWYLKLKWYYLLTAALAVLTLFAALYGATVAQDSYVGQMPQDWRGRPHLSPMTFVVPLFGIGLAGFFIYVIINAVCAFRFRPPGSYRVVHFVLNLLLYLALVLGWPMLVAALETFG